MLKTFLPASYFGIVLGLSGLGQSWLVAHKLWGFPKCFGLGLLIVATAIWALLILKYIQQAINAPEAVKTEFLHPVQGGTPALLGIATLLIVIAVEPYNHQLAWLLCSVGILWHLLFSLWHNGVLWKGGREGNDTVPTLYLPTVAGNFTSAAALGTLGATSWGWLFLGVGIFSWLSLESLIIQRLWQEKSLPERQRSLLGIQFAPPVVCAMALFTLIPEGNSHWLLLLWGYGLYQLLLGLRLAKWLGEQAFSPSYWAYTFGISAATLCGLKLSILDVPAAKFISAPLFLGANMFIGYLCIRTLIRLFNKQPKLSIR